MEFHFKLLRDLVSVPGVSGNEFLMDEAILDRLARIPGVTVTRDKLGSIIARLRLGTGLETGERAEGEAGRARKGVRENQANQGEASSRRFQCPRRPRVLLAAHKDTIGFLVKEVRPDGKLHVLNVGGNKVAPGHAYPVLVYRREMCLPGQLRVTEEGKRHWWRRKVRSGDASTKTKLWVTIAPEDDGAPSKPTDCVEVGDPVATRVTWSEEGQCITSAYLDDRVGCFLLLEILRHVARQPETYPPLDLYCAFTAMEEVGSRGALTSARGVDPDVALVVDVTWEGGPVRLGKGPALTMMDGGHLCSTEDRARIAAVARRHGVPLQFEVYETGASDARVIQTVGAGVPTFCILPPSRAPHSPREVVHKADVIHAGRLLHALIAEYPGWRTNTGALDNSPGHSTPDGHPPTPTGHLNAGDARE